MKLKPVNLRPKDINKLSKQQVVAKFTGWRMRNKEAINAIISNLALPELHTLKSYDLWLFFDAVERFEDQISKVSTPDESIELISDTEYFLRSMCPISIQCQDGKISYSRREYISD